MEVVWQHDPAAADADKMMSVTLNAKIYAQDMAIRYGLEGADGTNVLYDDGSTPQTANYIVGMIWNNPISSDEATTE